MVWHCHLVVATKSVHRPQDATKKIATITSPVKIEPNGSDGVKITGVEGDVKIQYSDGKPTTENR